MLNSHFFHPTKRLWHVSVESKSASQSSAISATLRHFSIISVGQRSRAVGFCITWDVTASTKSDSFSLGCILCFCTSSPKNAMKRVWLSQCWLEDWTTAWCYCMHPKSLQSCPTLCDPMDCSPPGSSAGREKKRTTATCVLVEIYSHLPLTPTQTKLSVCLENCEFKVFPSFVLFFFLHRELYPSSCICLVICTRILLF